MPRRAEQSSVVDSGDSVFIVVAAFNEEAAVFDVVSALRRSYSNVVVVDDGSDDATAELARAAGATVLQHALNRGQGAALQTGFEFALHKGAAYIVTFDSDGQHSPADIPLLLAPLVRNESDVALGSRFLGTALNMPRPRRWILRLAVLFTRSLSGLRVTDAHNGLRAFSRHAAESIEIRLDRMAHASEILDSIRRARLRVVEIPVSICYTEYSKRKGQKATAVVRIALDYLIGRWLR